jgi:threonine/homoserine/homoserine lactone efflux protein
MDLTLFLRFFSQGAALGLTAAATPGSLQTLLISETLLGGFKRGARVTLAPLIKLAQAMTLNERTSSFFQPLGWFSKLCS